MRIDCNDCAMQHTAQCDDCLVTALLHPPSRIVDIDDDLSDSLDALCGSGLVPALRFRPRGGTGREGSREAAG